ncbi:serine hydrolase [Arenimonas sp.]|uniref:D-alanyl-D-alanine carboxypeptidase family protein n=1 Tax=Arenimonas sp. TaxID=1872635 RepID=UPI0025C2B849|nr:serine hydrolase [Arenimonas sp.]
MRGFALAVLLGLAGTTVHASAPATAPTDAFPDVARAYRVEINGRPVWAGGDRQRLPMASLAKLMTALLLAESADLDQALVVSPAAARATGSRIGLRAGERMRASDLFDAMLVRSANDACRALADWHGGDLPRFVARMNARAAELGLHETTFANACGHDAPGQASSTRDLAALARAAMAQPRIADTVAKTRVAFRSPDGRDFAMDTTNALLQQFEGALGIKTGYTPGAGRCLVALARRGEDEVLVVMLHAPDRWWDTVALMELAFDHARRARAPAP